MEKISDFRVGDVIKTEANYKYIVTSLDTLYTNNPILNNYVTAMTPAGFTKEVWIPDIKEKIGFIDINKLVLEPMLQCKEYKNCRECKVYKEHEEFGHEDK